MTAHVRTKPSWEEVTAVLRDAIRTLEERYPTIRVNLKKVDVEFWDREVAVTVDVTE